jgi:hypothetical protein
VDETVGEETKIIVIAKVIRITKTQSVILTLK